MVDNSSIGSQRKEPWEACAGNGLKNGEWEISGGSRVAIRRTGRPTTGTCFSHDNVTNIAIKRGIGRLFAQSKETALVSAIPEPDTNETDEAREQVDFPPYEDEHEEETDKGPTPEEISSRVDSVLGEILARQAARRARVLHPEESGPAPELAGSKPESTTVPFAETAPDENQERLPPPGKRKQRRGRPHPPAVSRTTRKNRGNIGAFVRLRQELATEREKIQSRLSIINEILM